MANNFKNAFATNVSMNSASPTDVYPSATGGSGVNSILIELEDQTVVEVDTPPFAGDGWRLRLENIARGGKDHYLQLKVQTESGLRIDGLRVLYKLELFPHDALLGCAVEVPTLDGNVTLQVPPKSSTGRMLRLKGRGLTFEDNVGDQYVEILVVIPADIKDEEIALYTRLQELSLSDSLSNIIR